MQKFPGKRFNDLHNVEFLSPAHNNYTEEFFIKQ